MVVNGVMVVNGEEEEEEEEVVAGRASVALSGVRARPPPDLASFHTFNIADSPRSVKPHITLFYRITAFFSYNRLLRIPLAQWHDSGIRRFHRHRQYRHA